MIKFFHPLIRFSLEQTTIILLIISGWKSTLTIKLLLGVCTPILIILFWARYMAPMSSTRFPEIYRIITEIIIFGATTLIINNFLGRDMTIPYGLIVILDTTIEHVLK